jgi:hypothetical protein
MAWSGNPRPLAVWSALWRFRLVKTQRRENLAMGWNKEGREESTQSSRPHRLPSLRPEETLLRRLAAPAPEPLGAVFSGVLIGPKTIFKTRLMMLR